MSGVPERARVVIIGGGILGCSIAYWLTKFDERDVVILEQHEITDGATWHAAGLVGQLRSSRNTTRMLEQSVEMYRGLEAETGQAVDWHETGSLRLSCSPERTMELRRLTTMANRRWATGYYGKRNAGWRELYDGFVPDARLRKQILRGLRRWCKCELINLVLMLRGRSAGVTGVGLSAVDSAKADDPGNVSTATASTGAGSSALS